MAEWKKVVVSGSSAALTSLSVDGAVEAGTLSGSFSGSFQGDGSSLTGISADSLANSLTDGNGIADFSFDGSGAASVAVEADGTTLSVGGSGVKVADAGITATQLNTSVAGDGLAGGGGAALSVNVDDSSIETNGDALRVKASGVTNAMLAGSIENAKLANSAVTIGSTSVALGATAASVGGLTLTGAVGSGSFSGSFQGDGSSLTGVTAEWDGSLNGDAEITGSLIVSGSDVDLTVEGSGAFSGSNAVVTIDPSNTTIIDVIDSGGGTQEVMKIRAVNGTDQIRLRRNGGQNSLELLDNGGNSILLDSKNDGFYLNNFAIGASSADANNTLSVTGNIKTTSHITASDGTVSASAFIGDGSGLTNVTATLANSLTDGNGIADFSFDGSGTATVAVEADGTTLSVGGSGVKVADAGITATQLNSSVAGTGLSGGAGTALSVDYGSSAGTAVQGNATATFTGTANEVTVSDSSAQALGGNIAVTIGLPDDVTVGQDLTVTRDATITRNLIVQGTASFQHTTDLDIADRFIKMASGSTSNGSGGFAVQQTSAANSEALGWINSSVKRWGVTGSFDATNNSFTPDAFLSLAVVGGVGETKTDVPAKYAKAGNIFVQDNGDIHIYV